MERIQKQAADKLKEIEEKERQKAEEEKAKQEREERRKRGLEEGADGEKTVVVGVGAKSGVSYCTPRKVVPKMSNQIVGLKSVQDEDDDDVADVFKL